MLVVGPERGTGLEPSAGSSGSGTIRTATLHYLRSLALDLDGTGVHVGALAVNALITGSAMAKLAEANFPAEVFEQLPTVDPTDLAEA